jgi:hypothetical protein
VTGYFRQGPIAQRCTLIAIAFCSLTLAASCGRSKAMPEIKGKLPVFPVQGKLTFNRQPVPGADLMFYPVGGFPQGSSSILPRARTNEDGEFGVSTYGVTDGAPVGKYRVTASWKMAGDGRVSREQQDDSDEKLPEIYQNPKVTRLRVEVKEGEENVPTFEITDQKQASAS